MKVKLTFSVMICLFSTLFLMGQASEYKLSLKVIDKQLNNPLKNAEIFILPCECGGVSDEDGLFNIILPEKEYKISISYLGYTDNIQTITLSTDFSLEVALSENEEQLSEVVITAKKINDNLESPQMGVIQLKSNDLKKIPAAIGEFDILRGMTLLAGINNAGEISNGVSVRGGSLDQNLILYDYAPIFNPTHLFGLFSVFTPDVLESSDLYRANIPARYGGRVASVMDIKVKNPYVDKLKLKGGIGLVSSRLAIETPIIKDKLMLISGVRVGLTDFLLPIASKRLKKTKAKFGDATLKLLYLPTEKDQVFFTGFYSKDFYQLDLITKIENVNASSNQYDFSTFNGTLNWLHSFDEKTNLRTILIGSNYTPKIIFPEIENNNDIIFESKINYLSFISELSKNVNETFDYYAGIQGVRYKIDPGSLDPGSSNNILAVELNSETSYELSAFANINWKPTDYLTISSGLRYNYYSFVGPYTFANYDDLDGTIISTEEFEKNKLVKSYNGLEPRVGASLKLSKSLSLKASYARVNQYLQNVYNSTSPIPTSRWKTSDRYIEPQIGNTYNFGIYKNFYDNIIEMSLEGYYKETKNVLTYKPGADFFLERFLEQDVVQGIGKSYGVEYTIRKPKGRINGWVNYTWSRSLIRSQNKKLADRINNNDWFSSDFDRPHVVNATVNFEGKKYNTVSFNFTAQTGRPYTIANGYFVEENLSIPVFLKRNNARLPTYHRLDFSWKVKSKKSFDENAKWKSDWTFTVYNLLSRKNPFNNYYSQYSEEINNSEFINGPLSSFELSILNSPLFALTYNFTFN